MWFFRSDNRVPLGHRSHQGTHSSFISGQISQISDYLISQLAVDQFVWGSQSVGQRPAQAATRAGYFFEGFCTLWISCKCPPTGSWSVAHYPKFPEKMSKKGINFYLSFGSALHAHLNKGVHLNDDNILRRADIPIPRCGVVSGASPDGPPMHCTAKRPKYCC